MSKHNTLTWTCLLFFVIALPACKSRREKYNSVINKIKSANQQQQITKMPLEAPSQDLDSTKIIKVSEGENMFLILQRENQITSYSCNECHSVPLKKLRNDKKKIKKAHWNIHMIHADESTMNCLTCHSAENMNNLQSLTGKSITFNKSYRLCSQCHTKQFEDWKGGAHGKRVNGWAAPRIAMTCVNCHDPHDPHLQTRWPAVFNTHKAIERNE